MGNWYLYCKKGDFAAISEEFGISQIFARILVNRGLKTSDEIRSFLYDGRDSLHDPYLMKDMDKAVGIIMEAVSSKQKIRVIGDYDMDGVCASVILKKFFEYMGSNIDVRLPHRILEGYGMNISMAEDAERDGISLIVTCDNGISSADAVARANELGIDVVVTDHHEPPAVLPKAAAIVDAKQADCSYPYKELCGAAVCYKLCQAVLDHIDRLGFVFPEGRSRAGLESVHKELIQFAGMATIADIVSLTGENRVFAKEGLNVLKNTGNPGLNALMNIRGIAKEDIDSYHIGFIISPCINSAGRLDNAKIAFDLFDTDDPAKAEKIASDLSDLNEKRKALTIEQSERAEQIIAQDDIQEDDNRVIVIYLPDAHESIAGIIAGKLKEEYCCPVLIITDSEEGLKGSGRSTDDYNLIEALARHPELFKKYGGHAKAAGFTLKCTPEELSETLNREEQAQAISRENRVWIDMQLPFRYVTSELTDEIRMLEPYGLDNDRPLFAEKHVRFTDLRVIGRNSNVLKMQMIGPDGGRIEGIYFGHGNDRTVTEVLDFASGKGEQAYYSILYRANINEFRGMRYPQAVIEEIRAEK